MGKASRRKRERHLMVVVGKGGRERTVPISDEAVEIIEAQEQAFREKFGRDPGPNDPIFFDADQDTPQPYPVDIYRASLREAMVKANLRPELIYATDKTGLMATEENWEKMLPEDRAAWNAAIDEYFEKLRTRPS